MKRTAVYLGKISKLDDDSLPKKFLAAWINGNWKNGAPQLTCNNNFAETIDRILPPHKTLSSKNAPLMEWLSLAKEENKWQLYIDNYFKMCRKYDPHEESVSDSDDETEGPYYPCPYTTTVHTTTQNLRYKIYGHH
jgi:hypothetical protein